MILCFREQAQALEIYKQVSLEWIERAFEECENLLIFPVVNPDFDDLHSDKRFQDLLQRIGLMQ
jgi:hypothetical protein